MNRVIVLDTGVAGILTNPHPSALNEACQDWFDTLQAMGDTVVLPEIVDYELRREMVLQGAVESLYWLNDLTRTAKYVPLVTMAIRQAARFWAQVRRQARPTADRHALDGDVILAAQAALLDDPGGGVIIATTNVKHLSLVADARLWTEIDPAG
jgi:hypothetical protein